MILGVVLAGGKSSRFGSDKALAQIGGRNFLDLAIENMANYCDKVVLAGRNDGPVPGIVDWPRAGCGPLGGLAAGLRHACEQNYPSILTCGVDSIDLPADLVDQLLPAPAFVASQPVIGHWPIGAREVIERILLGQGPHSMFAFAKAIDARPVTASRKPANINTPADLAARERQDGL